MVFLPQSLIYHSELIQNKILNIERKLNKMMVVFPPSLIYHSELKLDKIWVFLLISLIHHSEPKLEKISRGSKPVKTNKTFSFTKKLLHISSSK